MVSWHSASFSAAAAISTSCHQVKEQCYKFWIPRNRKISEYKFITYILKYKWVYNLYSTLAAWFWVGYDLMLLWLSYLEFYNSIYTSSTIDGQKANHEQA
jgi:hypothetical protein